MTKEARRTYRVTSNDVTQINFVLGLLADRIDELEGRRGTPTFKSDVNMDSNRVTSVGNATTSTDAITLSLAQSVATDAAGNAVDDIESAVNAAQNWLIRKVIDSDDVTILHGFDVTEIE